MENRRLGTGPARRLLPYFVLSLLIFYAVPLFCKRTPGSTAMAAVMLLLLLASPGYSLVGGIMYGWNNGFSPWFAVMVAATFFPSIFLFYNVSAWFYVPVFGLLAVLGTAAGAYLSRKKRD